MDGMTNAMTGIPATGRTASSESSGLQKLLRSAGPRSGDPTYRGCSLAKLVFDSCDYFDGAGGSLLGRRGKSKDSRPQCPRLVVGLALSSDRRPLCTGILPGRTADVTTLLPVWKPLRERFELVSACLVADRSMISRATMDELEQRGWCYILGWPIRNAKECHETVSRDRREKTLLELECKGRREQLRPHVREVRVRNEEDGSERHCVVCRYGEQARRDTAVREAIVDRLQEQQDTGRIWWAIAASCAISMQRRGPFGSTRRR